VEFYKEKMLKENKGFYVNHDIVASVVRVIDSNDENLGQMPLSVAINLAAEQNLCLVQIAIKEDDTVICKILDYGKYMYEQSKKKKHKKKNNIVKEIRVNCNIDSHDLEVKKKKIISFLEKEYKVRFSMKLRGRERSREKELLVKFVIMLEDLESYAHWVSPKIEGQIISTMLNPIKV